MSPLPLVALLALSISVAGCSAEPSATTKPGPYDELERQGLAMYLDADDAVVESQEASVTTWTWPVDPDGNSPACFHGEQYRVSTRDAASDNLIVFLQGGGACWSELCIALSRARAGIPKLDVLDSELSINPVRSWNVVYLPYCDASLFIGDARFNKPDGSVDRDHRGLRNLSAALTVAKARYPKPKRILLAGSSGGGFGTIFGLPLATMIWPEAEIMVMNDSGVGVAKPDQPAFLATLVKEFNVGRFMPKSCPKCATSSHLTELIGWTLQQDDRVRMAAFSATRDFVISTLFLKLDGAVFEKALRGEVKVLQSRFAGRYAAFLTPGTTHTTLLGDVSGFVTPAEEGEDSGGIDLSALASFLGGMRTTKTGDVAFKDWFKAFIDGADGWVPVAPAE